MHYIEVCSKRESDDSDLELGTDVGRSESPRVEGTLGSMIVSLHEVKCDDPKITLNKNGQALGFLKPSITNVGPLRHPKPLNG